MSLGVVGWAGRIEAEEKGTECAREVCQGREDAASVALAAPVRAEAQVSLKVAEEEKAEKEGGGAGEMRFNGRLVRPVRTIRMRVTAYCPEACCCGKSDGITASGQSVWNHGLKLVAADTRVLPFGTPVSVPGYNGGQVVPVLDRGGKIKGHRLDVLMPTHKQAKVWGVQELDVTVWGYAD